MPPRLYELARLLMSDARVIGSGEERVRDGKEDICQRVNKGGGWEWEGRKMR